MRKYIAVLLFCVTMGFIQDSAYAGWYVFGNGGGGGEADTASGGLEGGGIFKPDAKIGYLLGGGFSIADRAKTEERGNWDTEFTNEGEGYFAFGIRPIIKGLYLVGTAGASVRESSDTWHTGTSAGTIEGFESDEGNEGYFTTSGQIRYIWKHLMIGAGYHNRRGVIGGIGFAW